ncbi:hypothetical protein Taro_046619 [Colocasia esculenta]|uniref:Homogentisate phytyltransferase 1, chloroplastic n=1 Tax=Colocasia esculenta TaxID=4460 RepID=A0A843WZI6_COLES|nr:hypothetical protein [Colocasia esculenta]
MKRLILVGLCEDLQISNCKVPGEVDGLRFRRFQGCLRNHYVKCLDKWAVHGRPNKPFSISATSGESLGSEPEAYSSQNTWSLIRAFLDAFYRFSRPHTLSEVGFLLINDTIVPCSFHPPCRPTTELVVFVLFTSMHEPALSIVSVSLLAVEKLSDISPLFLTGLLEAVVAALFMNIYIVGLNQLFDIEIDKVNKPNLPLASGEYSVRTGTAIISTFACMSFFTGWMVGSWPLFWALFISFVLGTAYSINLPFLRWKRFAVVAAMCILAVRAVIVQLAFFLHMQTFVFSRPAVLTRPLIFATAFMSFFSVVIALFKDIPDIDGDRIFGIRSFSVRLGQEKVFWICVYLLQLAYSVAVVVGALSPSTWSKWITKLKNQNSKKNWRFWVRSPMRGGGVHQWERGPHLGYRRWDAARWESPPGLPTRWDPPPGGTHWDFSPVRPTAWWESTGAHWWDPLPGGTPTDPLSLSLFSSLLNK